VVRVLFNQNHSSDIPVLKVTGHAEFASKGNDIVCSAVSILMYTFADAAERIAGCELSVIDTEEYMVYIKQCSSREKFLTIAETIITGISSLANQYPENVTLTIN
jgi:uncharacterized protein YsxB (DUF464 family)